MSNGMIMLCSGVFLLLLSSIFLIIFIRGEKKKKNTVDETLFELTDKSTELLHNGKENAFAETEVLEEKGNTETVPMENEKTEIMKF